MARSSKAIIVNLINISKELDIRSWFGTIILLLLKHEAMIPRSLFDTAKYRGEQSKYWDSYISHHDTIGSDDDQSRDNSLLIFYLKLASAKSQVKIVRGI